MMDPQELTAELLERFGIKELTPEQAWTLVNYVKHCRFRCRNNAALNNYHRKAFPHLSFAQVEKRKRPTEEYPDGELYEGLQIVYRDHAKQKEYEELGE